MGQGGTSQLWLSSHLSVCLSVTVSLCLCLSLILSACVSVSLSASLSFSFTLSVWFCVHVCLSVSPSLPVSLSLYQILSTSSIIFSYSLILTCFFLIPVSVPWFCAIQKVFIINYQMKIHTRGVISLFVKQQYETTKWEKSESKFWNKLGCFSGLTMGKGSSVKQQAGQMKLLSDLLSAYPKNISFTGAWPKKMQTDLIHNMDKHRLTFHVNLHVKCANTDWPSVWNSAQNVQTMTNH